jgi:hypothetical protein
MEKDTSSKQGGSIIITGTLVSTNIDVIQVEQTRDIKVIGIYAPVEPDGTLKGSIYCFYTYASPEPRAEWHALMIFNQGTQYTVYVSEAQKSTSGYIKFSMPDWITHIDKLNRNATCILDETKIIEETDEKNNKMVFYKNNNVIPSNNLYLIIEDPPIDNKKRSDVKASKLDFTAGGGLSLLQVGIPPGKFQCNWEWSGDIVDTEWKLQILVDNQVIGEKIVSSSETAQRSGSFIVEYKGLGFINKSISTKCVVDTANVLDEFDETNNTAERIFK